jgi:diguanylate cyclase (GGDEF)-like protein
MGSKNIVWKYILTLSLILAGVVIVRVFYDIKHHNNMLKNQQESLSENITRQFLLSEQDLVNKYYMLSNHLMHSKTIYHSYQTKNREELYRFLERDYEDFIRVDPFLYVMHFFDKSNITFLRMHKPEQFNDDLTKQRPLVAYVNQSLKKEHAFEVGRNGVVYRITVPLFHYGEHFGILEFGIKPEYFVERLNKMFNVQSLILVKSSALKTLSTKRDYATLNEYSIISKDPVFKKIKNKLDISKLKQTIKAGDKTYLVLNNLSLSNYQDQTISKIVLIKDITPVVEKNYLSLFNINLITLMVFLLIVTLLYIVLNRFSNDIQENIQTITKLHKRSSRLLNKANTDPLTNIFNKRYFNGYLKEFFRSGKEGVLIFLDIDHFKKINDTYGHLIGDEILKKLTVEIKTHLRDEDTFVRWGGEEFIILFEDTDLKKGIIKAEEIRKLVENITFPENIKVTISIGVTKKELSDTIKKLLERADELLYKAKKSGRNCIKH